MLLETNAITIETDTLCFEQLAHERWCCKMHPPSELAITIDDSMCWNIRTPSDSIERPSDHVRC
ncbi:MAG: hypothetical protein AA908_08350 [Chlorobi bacterium NICIL-2]|jgi:hypothetical protein|nr:MAG: hypothetical protein AA908_08350 [Chlorobi bacterium NICIL-2]